MNAFADGAQTIVEHRIEKKTTTRKFTKTIAKYFSKITKISSGANKVQLCQHFCFKSQSLAFNAAAVPKVGTHLE